jgi:hypothetical protein
MGLLPVKLQHATNRVGNITKLHTVVSTFPWSCEVKEGEELVLLVPDRQNSHTRNTQLLHLARENGVYVLCWPQHRTKEIQQLAFLFHAPFKNFICGRKQSRGQD